MHCRLSLCDLYVFFFFQAEDGIRDYKVTGVQTCALPISGLVPAFMPGRLFWAYFVGVAFFAAAAGILYEEMARPAATMLGVMFFLFVEIGRASCRERV